TLSAIAARVASSGKTPKKTLCIVDYRSGLSEACQAGTRARIARTMLSLTRRRNSAVTGAASDDGAVAATALVVAEIAGAMKTWVRLFVWLFVCTNIGMNTLPTLSKA